MPRVARGTAGTTRTARPSCAGSAGGRTVPCRVYRSFVIGRGIQSRASAGRPTPTTAANLPALPVLSDQKPREQFAANQPPGVKDVAFDADKAMQHVKDLCAIGPRISATEGMKKQQELIIKHFEGCGATVVKQEFEAKQISRREKTPMVNLVFQWNPD